MKIIFSFLLAFLCSSCFSSFFGVPSRLYNYEYKSFAKTIDYSKGNWLLIPISSTSYGFNEDASYALLKNFLYSKLDKRLKVSNELKDSNNKYVIPFDLEFDKINENFSDLRNLTNCDYVITSKISYLDDSYNIDVNENHKKGNLKKREYKSACKISLIAYDLKSEKEIFNLDCLGYIWISDNNERAVSIYQTSKSASLGVMKKILKKIK